MAPIFQNLDLQKRFETFGYVVIPFLENSEVDTLLNSFQKHFPEVPKGFYSTSFSTNEAAKKALSVEINSVFFSKTPSLFAPFRPLGNCVLSKSPGSEGEMPIHQDWTMVDEPHFQSLTIWVPLCDVNEKNGAMQVIPGSHNFSDALRSPTLPNPLTEIYSDLKNDLVSIPLKAGEALIFSQALMHASPPNLSESSRAVVTFGLVPQDAKLYFYFSEDSGKVEKYAVPDDFFGKYNTAIGKRPTIGEKISEFAYSHSALTSENYKLKLKTFLKEKLNLIKMKTLFKDTKHQSQFEKEGFLVLPLLNNEKTNSLKTFYESLGIKDENGFGFHVSMDSPNKDLSLRIRQKLWDTILPELDRYLIDYKPFVASFVAKDPNPKGVVPAHQDWTFTDCEEEGYFSLTCWVSLVATTLDNGQMGVIKGSHKLMQNHRPSPSPQAPVPLSDAMFSIFPYLKTLDMQPGEVLFFDNRTFHASPPNITNQVRLAAGVGITQKDAQLIHYYLKPDGTKQALLKYAVDAEFFIHYNNARLAKMYDAGKAIEDYRLLGEVPYHFEKYDAKDLIQMIKDAGNEYNVPMCERLAELFNFNADGSPKASPEMQDENTVSMPKENYKEEKKSFFQTYTPYNIYREAKYRITGK